MATYGFCENKCKYEIYTKEEVDRVQKTTIVKEDEDIKITITARKQLNIVNLFISMDFKTTDILVDFNEAIPTEYRPSENIRIYGSEYTSTLLIGTAGNIKGTYADKLPNTLNISYIVD